MVFNHIPLIICMRTLIIGRWQPLHLGHLSMVQEAAEQGEIIIIIGSAQESNTLKNPFSAEERIQMWKEVLRPLGIRPTFVDLPDFPDDNDLWVETLLSMCPPFDRVVTGCELSFKLLKEAGLKVEKPKFTNAEAWKGTNVRELMAKGDTQWKGLIPKPVMKYLEKIKGEERVKKIAQKRGPTTV